MTLQESFADYEDDGLNPEHAGPAPHGHGSDAQAGERSRRAMIELLDAVFAR